MDQVLQYYESLTQAQNNGIPVNWELGARNMATQLRAIQMQQQMQQIVGESTEAAES